MKKWLVLLLIVGMVAISGMVTFLLAKESTEDSESQMDDYVNMVLTLQNGDSTSRDSVLNVLKASRSWTMLDEIGDYEVDEIEEYMALELNDLAYEAAASRQADYGSPKGVFVDGRDKDYDICFIEKCLAPGSEVVYDLTKRRGIERVAVVEMSDGDLDVMLNSSRIESSNGQVFLTEFTGSDAQLRIRNRRSYIVSFVIINEH